MDQELYEFAKDNDLDYEEAEEVQSLADDLGLGLDEALEVYEEI